MEKRNIPKWLKSLQENSWELELLISGGAIFSLFQITDLFIAWLDTFRMISPMLGTNIVFMSVLLTFKMFILDKFEYVIKPKLNIFDAPLIEVIELASNPPVHDSANEILSFFLINVFTKDFIR